MGLLSRMVTCPYCGRSINLADCPVVATNYDVAGAFTRPERGSQTGATPVSGGRTYGEFFGQPVLRPPRGQGGDRQNIFDRVARAIGEGDVAPISSLGLSAEDLPARACANCGTPLPDDIGEREIMTIGVIGSTHAGKTHYLAELIRDGTQRQGLRRWGIEEFALDESSDETFDRLYRPFFYNGQAFAPTTPGESRDIRFRPLAVRAKYQNGDKFVLLFHDIAGETLLSRKERARDASFLRNAAGLIFLIDPVMIETIMRRLPSEYNTRMPINQARLINACVSDLGANSIRVPIAITLSKSDLIDVALPQQVGKYWFRREASQDRQTAIKQMGWIDTEVRNLLGSAGALDLLAMADQLGPNAPVTFHAVAPIGFTPPNRPDSPVEDRRGTPLRCLDPLIAILSAHFSDMLR